MNSNEDPRGLSKNTSSESVPSEITHQSEGAGVDQWAKTNDNRTPEHFANRVFLTLFSIAIAFHLALPDARQLSWLVPNFLVVLGTFLIWNRRKYLEKSGWLLAALGLISPLLFLGDTLTQSVLLFLLCLGGLFTDAPRRVARVLTPLVYLTAAFHKTNTDFLNPEVSCATGGVRLLLDNWGIEQIASPILSIGEWPELFLIAELLLAALLFVRPRLGVAFASLFHIPLTIVFAPAFAWVMAPGVVASLSPRELIAMRAFFRRKKRTITSAGLLFALISTLFYFKDHWVPYPIWQLAEALLWIAASLCVGFVFSREARELTHEKATPQKRRVTLVTALLSALWFGNAATPYLGLQFHHTAAMLSNLRIDPGCWNHFLVPESARLADPYLRIINQGQLELEGTLVESGRLVHALENTCSEQDVSVELEYHGENITVTCANLREGVLTLSTSKLSDFGARLFQRNLTHDCPSRCIH